MGTLEQLQEAIVVRRGVTQVETQVAVTDPIKETITRELLEARRNVDRSEREMDFAIAANRINDFVRASDRARVARGQLQDALRRVESAQENIQELIRLGRS